MFVGSLDAAEKEGALQDVVRQALDFLRKTDFASLPDGRYEIDGDRCYATLSRYTTRDRDACRPEAHRRYADIQYMVEGEEYIEVCPLGPDLVEHTPYDEARDIVFFEGLVPETSFPLTTGHFALLLPKDVHRPGVAVETPRPVVKVVVKIDVALMAGDRPTDCRR